MVMDTWMALRRHTGIPLPIMYSSEGLSWMNRRSFCSVAPGLLSPNASRVPRLPLLFSPQGASRLAWRSRHVIWPTRPIVSIGPDLPVATAEEGRKP